MNTIILQLVAISIEDRIGNNNPPRQGNIEELKLLLHSYYTMHLQHT